MAKRRYEGAAMEIAELIKDAVLSSLAGEGDTENQGDWDDVSKYS